MYNDQSVLEMHHAATMFRLLRSQERRQRRKRPSPPPAAAGDESTTASPALSPVASASSGATGGAGAAASSAAEAEPVELETVVSVLGLLPAEFIAFRKLAIAGILATGACPALCPEAAHCSHCSHFVMPVRSLACRC